MGYLKHISVDLEAFIAAKNFGLKDPNQKVVMSVPMIDSKSYSFYDDSIGFSYTLDSVRRCKVNLYILNSSLPQEASLIAQFTKLENTKVLKISEDYSAILIY